MWLDKRSILWTHPPNGGHRNKATAAALKRQGAKAGCPDVLVFSRPPDHPEFRGVAIELKRVNGGAVSPEQTAWLKALDREGWHCSVCEGHAEAIQVLESLGFS